MTRKSEKILIKADEPLDVDPDSSNSCIFRDLDGKYYRVFAAGVNSETEHLKATWQVREAVRITCMERQCEMLLVPNPLNDSIKNQAECGSQQEQEN